MRLRRKILNLRPVVIFALSLVFGVVFSFTLYKTGIVSILIPLAFFSLLIVALFFLFGDAGGKIIIISVSAILFIVSALSFYITVRKYENAETGGGYYSVDGRVKGSISTDYGEKLVLTDLVFSGQDVGYDMTVYVYGERGADIGDKIRFFGQINDIPVFYEDEFSAENIGAKIRYSAVVDSSEITIYGNYKTPFESVNVKIRETLNEGLDGREFAIGYAMLTGNDDFMDRDVLESFRNAGVAHVFAVSGLHIGFVALILSFILKKLKVNGIIAATVTVLCLLAYSGICGFTASSLRATVMCAVLLFSRLGGFRYDGLSSVALAGALILLFSPVQLFCVGFRLSFCVVIFITVFTKLFAKIFKFLPRKIATAAGAVIAAFFAGVPVSLAAFGKFSLVAVPFNFIFIPVAGVIFTVLFVCCVLSMIFPIAEAVFIPLAFVLKAVNAVVTFFDYDAFLISGIFIGAMPVFYYACFFFSSGLLNIKRAASVILSVICMCVFLAGTAALTFTEFNSAKGYVLGNDGFSAAVITRSDESVMIVADASETFSVSVLRRLKERCETESLSGVFVVDESADLNNLASRLLTAFKIENIFVYGEEDLSVKTAIERSFPGVKVFFPEVSEISFGGFSVNYGAGGKFAVADFKGEKYSFYGKFGESGLGGTDFTDRYRGVIAFDYVETIAGRTGAGAVYAFRRNEKYENGESAGIRKFYFD